jgi:hypothetical protein
MPLADLIKHPPPERPSGITCDRYRPDDGKRCAYYLDNGACTRPDEFMCTEWLKRNAAQASSPTPEVATPAPVAPSSPAKPVASLELKEGSLLTREDAEKLRDLGVELELKSPVGSFWIVPVRTGQDRMELLPEEAVLLVNCVQVFGGRVVALTRKGQPLPDADADAVAAARELAPPPSKAEIASTDAKRHLAELRNRLVRGAGR